MALIDSSGNLVEIVSLGEIDPPGLSERDVHVWFGHFGSDDAAASEFENLLSPDEHARANRFVFAHHRERFVRAHGVLRLVLAAYAKCQAAELSFAADRYGKPAFSDVKHLRFSLSHSANGVAVAVAADDEVGVDIECPHEMVDRSDFVRRFFSPSEIAAYEAAETNMRKQVFFRLWTRKEAFLKGIGLGLSRPLDSFSVGIGIPVDLEAPNDGSWFLHHLEPGDGFVGALACGHPSPNLQGWRLNLQHMPR
jgi:4'-phosphopantetheinyl transferase